MKTINVAMSVVLVVIFSISSLTQTRVDESAYAKAQSSGLAQLPRSKSIIGAIGNLVYVIASVEPDSPADRVGLRPGDIVMKINRLQFTSEEEFAKLMQSRPNTETSIQILRSDIDNFNSQWMRTLQITPNLPSYSIGVTGRTVFILQQVLPGSPASNAGLRAGDLVEQVNGKQFVSLQEFKQFSQSTPGAPVLFKVARPMERSFRQYDVLISTVSPSDLKKP